jgi:hypothetical protein
VITTTGKKTTSVVTTAPSAVQYQYKAAAVQYQYAAPAAEAELPETGGSGLLPIGAMVLLLGGGLTALLAVRRGTSG